MDFLSIFFSYNLRVHLNQAVIWSPEREFITVSQRQRMFKGQVPVDGWKPLTPGVSRCLPGDQREASEGSGENGSPCKESEALK